MAPNPVPLSPRRLAASGLRLRANESAFREGSATIVMPTANSAFFNPVQEFNRDLSVLAMKTWSEGVNEDLKKKWEAKLLRKAEAARKGGGGAGNNKKKRTGDGDAAAGGAADGAESDKKRIRVDETTSAAASTSTPTPAASSTENASSAVASSSAAAAPVAFRPHKFTLLEALAATGMRSIRYAREIPLLRYVVANDMSPGAIKAMKRNVALNFPADRPLEEWVPEKGEEDKTAVDADDADMDAAVNGAEVDAAVNDAGVDAAAGDAAGVDAAADDSPVHAGSAADGAAPLDAADVAAAEAAIHPDCKIRMNEGDALDVMYSHRHPTKRFDCVDLDPYGTAAPFIDGAVQSVADGGLLCVTCTDSAVLASNSYPEKAFALYGGSSTRAEYSHEMGLRLVLHLISSTAAKYGRYIEPQLSLSIDFYVRLFIRVYTGPAKVKPLASKTGVVYTCSHCANFHAQPMGRMQTTAGKNNTEHARFHNASGPPAGMGSKCEECGSNYLVAGPMWLAPIHNESFCRRLLDVLDREPEKSKTAPRIRGMVGLAADELRDSMFYFLPQRVTGVMHCTSPSFLQCASALLRAGYQVSRSHTSPGSLKTDAPRARVFDLLRAWIKQGHPVKMENVKTNSPSRVLLEKQAAQEDEFPDIASSEYHPRALLLADRKSTTIRDNSKRHKAVKYQSKPMANWGPGKAAPMH